MLTGANPGISVNPKDCLKVKSNCFPYLIVKFSHEEYAIKHDFSAKIRYLNKQKLLVWYDSMVIF